jgi:hypothetical protein
MRCAIAALAGFFLLAFGAQAHAGVPFASELVTVGVGATGITAALCRVGGNANGASTSAIVEVVTNSIYYTLHDSAATPDATGHTLSAGGVIELAEPYKWRAIRAGGSDATVRVTCIDRLQDTKILKGPGAAGAGGDGAVLDGVSSSIKATVFDRTNSNPLATQLVDSNGDPVSVGGGTQYNQGTVAGATDSLTMAGCVRSDAAAVDAGVINGDRARCIVDATGKLWVQVGTVTVTGPDFATQTTLALIKTAIDAIKVDVDKIPASPSTETTLALIKAKTDNLDAAISTLLTIADFDSKTGALTETAPATDTASSGLNGRLQRIAQRLTSLIALLPAALGAGGGLKVDGSGTALPTSLASIPDSSGQGATGDAAATVGSTGSLSAKLRLITSQLDAITTSVQLIDNMISGSGVNVSQINGVAPLMGNGVTGTGSPRVTIASDNTTLTNTFGNVGEVPITSGGTAIFRRVSTADTNIANVKASAGQVYQIVASNVNAAARYIHLYNTSGSPTCNTSIISTFIIPGGGTSGGGTNIPLPPGAAFGTGIGICITTAVDGTGSVAANEIVLNIFYK